MSTKKWVLAIIAVALIAAGLYFFMSNSGGDYAATLPAANLQQNGSASGAQPAQAGTASADIDAAVSDALGSAQSEAVQADSENGTENTAQLTSQTDGSVYAD